MDRTEPNGIYCLSCGLQLPADARYCDKCGARQSTPAERANSPKVAPSVLQAAHWEYCEIVYQGKNWGRFFVALAMGPDGLHEVLKEAAGFGAPNPGPANEAVVQGMVSTLIAWGWEPQPKGPEWFSHRFRQVARAPRS